MIRIYIANERLADEAGLSFLWKSQRFETLAWDYDFFSMRIMAII